MAEFAEADVGEGGRDLADPTGAEIEEPGRGDRVDDAVDERPLEPQRDAVLRVLRELEAGLLLGPRDEDVDGAGAEDGLDGGPVVLEPPVTSDQQVLARTCLDDGHRSILPR